MPRPKRTRRAPAQPAKAKATIPNSDIEASDSDAPRQAQPQSPERGRRRSTRNMAPRPDAAKDDASTGSRVQDDAESGSSIEIGRRDIATPAHRRDTTGLDLADDDVFGDLDDSFEHGEIPQGLQSADNSSITLSSFKRRSRQSSFIGRNDPQIRPSSRGGNTPSISSTLHFGNFRRRAREPSILGTARKALPDETNTEQADQSESEDEFLPEAESTPVNNRRRTQPAPEVEQEHELSPEEEINTQPSKSRKRKSDDAILSSDRPEKSLRLDNDDQDEGGEEQDEPEDEPVAELEDESDTSSLSSISSPLGPPPILPVRARTPFDDEEIMAPPASSDSEDNGDIWPDIHTLAKRRRRPSFTTPRKDGGDDMSDISSPPSLTHSPNYAPNKAPATRGRAASRRQPSPEVTTADLTSMLPRRRYRPRGGPEESDGEYDVTEMPQGEDELSYVDSRAARRRQGSRPPSRATSARPASRGGRAAHSALKPRQTAASTLPASRNVQTYSQRSSDKENEREEDENDESRFEPLPDDTFDTGASQSGETTSADELKKATKKFKEVDRWELEFEEITQSSSPSGAR
ncbi:hypothetical protein BGZ63DRAFT_374477 [Mariannaea sp. PMI_226]|nr:hypothetical protein BGZ63DRAFT_374477 [Mariannaea sp. PMI_226]